MRPSLPLTWVAYKLCNLFNLIGMPNDSDPMKASRHSVLTNNGTENNCQYHMKPSFCKKWKCHFYTKDWGSIFYKNIYGVVCMMPENFCLLLSRIFLHYYDGYYHSIIRVQSGLFTFFIALVSAENFFMWEVTISLKMFLCVPAETISVQS